MNKRENERNPVETPAHDAAHDALAEELEALRDLFQKELDRAKNAPDDAALPVKDGAPDAPPDADEGPVCACCGAPLTDADADAPYCEECLTQMRTRPVHAAAALFVLAAFLLAAVGLYLFSDSAAQWRQLFSAQRAVHRLLDAADRYGDCFLMNADRDSVSLTGIKAYADLCRSLGDVDLAALLVDARFPGPLLKLPWNARYRALLKLQAQFAATEQVAIDIFGAYDDYTDAAVYEDVDAQLCALRTDDTYAPVAVEYIRYLLMKAAGKPAALQMQQLEQMEAVDDGCYTGYYLAAMIELAGETGGPDAARTYFQTAIERNGQDQNAYDAFVRVLRRQPAPDTAAIFSVAQAAQANAPARGKPVWLRLFAVSDLLRGDDAQALREMQLYMTACYEQQLSLTMEEWNLYALCAAAAGDEDACAQIETALGSAQLKLSPVIGRVRAGTWTAAEALRKDGGDIA